MAAGRRFAVQASWLRTWEFASSRANSRIRFANGGVTL